MKKLLKLICVLFLILGCTKKSIPISTNGIFIIGAPCKITKDQGIDAEIGTIICDSIVLNYEYGRYSNPGPLTEIEKFKMAFRGKYHSVFFEKIYIDTKLYKQYMDSVQVMTVTKLQSHNKTLLFDCSVCNQVATLKFRKATYRFPFYNDQSITERTNFKMYIDTVGNYHRKIYLSQNGASSGLYLSPLENAKQGNKLSIQTESKGKQDYIFKLLQSVRLTPHK